MPIGDISSAANCTLFDHLIGAREQHRRDCEAERLGGDQIDDQIELGRLLDRGEVAGAAQPPAKSGNALLE